MVMIKLTIFCCLLIAFLTGVMVGVRRANRIWQENIRAQYTPGDTIWIFTKQDHHPADPAKLLDISNGHYVVERGSGLKQWFTFKEAETQLGPRFDEKLLKEA